MRVRPTFAEVDLDAVAHNVAHLVGEAAPASVCAVVKADAYGHGAVAVARAALQAGATWLAVALVEEAAELREAGIRGPILLLSEPPGGAMATALSVGVTPTVCTAEGIAAAADAAYAAHTIWPVHLKVDTGMHRVGCDPNDAATLAGAIDSNPNLELQGVCTHLAAADEPERGITDLQLDRFDKVLARLAELSLAVPLVHAANSAGTLLHPRSRYDLVRAGISIYGYPPAAAHERIAVQLRPALRLVSQVAQVRRIESGEGVSYGHRFVADEPTTVATVPIGYADGVRRSLGYKGGEVLIRGRRHPIIGVVTMDQLMVACGEDVRSGDEVVLIGRQQGEQITADDVARVLETISYEVLCDIGARVPRVYRT